MIIEVTDKDFGIEIKEIEKPRIRYAARGIIYNNEDKIALLYKKNKNQYKLIGGGKENNEKIEETFIREVMEETGYSIDIKENLGVAIEKKSQDNFIQYSTIFVGKILKKEKSENYTIEELKDGSSIVWVDIVDAIQLIKNSLSSLKYIDIKSYHDLFILKRDVLILECYAKMHNII